MSVRVEPGNCLEVMRRLAEEGVRVDCIVTDPPYHLQSISKRFANSPRSEATERYAVGAYGRHAAGFMGKAWDGGDVAFNPVTWGTAAELLKPGGWLLAFGGTRTYHRLGWAIEGGGFEIRDCIAWMFGSGFPKSHNVAAAIDRASGQPPRGKAFNYKGRGERADEFDANGREHLPPYEAATEEAAQWQGWGTALKPAFEPICVARKPLGEKTVAANVLKHGTGALNVDGCRVETNGGRPWREARRNQDSDDNRRAYSKGLAGSKAVADTDAGRWPANVCHDGSPEVEAAFAAFDAPRQQRAVSGGERAHHTINAYGEFGRTDGGFEPRGDSGSPSRFYYTAKADKHDRWGSKHPTVKPIDLMRWLVRLVTPPGGTVLDPFAGSGTTAIACMAEGFDCILIEREDEYLADIRERLAFYEGDGKHSLAAKNRKREQGHDDLPLFGGAP